MLPHAFVCRSNDLLYLSATVIMILHIGSNVNTFLKIFSIFFAAILRRPLIRHCLNSLRKSPSDTNRRLVLFILQFLSAQHSLFFSLIISSSSALVNIYFLLQKWQFAIATPFSSAMERISSSLIVQKNLSSFSLEQVHT